MALIYITGPAGAGKTTIRRLLLERGFEAHDTDEDGLAIHADRTTGVRIPYPADESERTPEWHAEHVFNLVQEQIEMLHKNSREKDVYICGAASNDLRLAYLFDTMICLQLPLDVALKRIHTRSTNSYGKSTDEEANIKRSHNLIIDKYRQAGAIMIDVTSSENATLDTIIDVVRKSTIT